MTDIAATMALTIPVTGTSAGIIAGGTAGNVVDEVAAHNAISSMLSAVSLPTQTGNSGKYLSTDGTNCSWNTLSALPTVSGTDNGNILTVVSGVWAKASPPSGTLPTQTGNSGLFLTTDGTNAAWAAPFTNGTFSPTIFGSTTAGTPTYVVQAGKWYKFGPMVYVSIYLQWSALASAAGELRVGNLPYSSTAYSTFSVHYSGLVVGTGKELEALLLAGDSFIRLQTGDQAGGAAGSVAIDTSVADILLSGWYIAS